MDYPDEFEQHVMDVFGYSAVKSRVMLKVALGLGDEIKKAVAGSPVEDDINGLLVLTRLTMDEQRLTAKLIGKLITAGEAVHLVVCGDMQEILQYCQLAQWIEEL